METNIIGIEITQFVQDAESESGQFPFIEVIGFMKTEVIHEGAALG